jgi:hypothetical protein
MGRRGGSGGGGGCGVVETSLTLSINKRNSHHMSSTHVLRHNLLGGLLSLLLTQQIFRLRGHEPGSGLVTVTVILNPFATSMARTKQTAQKSTGDSAP